MFFFLLVYKERKLLEQLPSGEQSSVFAIFSFRERQKSLYNFLLVKRRTRRRMLYIVHTCQRYDEFWKSPEALAGPTQYFYYYYCP
jgi:hypothetical protein